MSKRLLLFAPVTFNLAETTHMIEIAKGIRQHPAASQAFDIQFISDGGEFKLLYEKFGKQEPEIKGNGAFNQIPATMKAEI